MENVHPRDTDNIFQLLRRHLHCMAEKKSFLYFGSDSDLLVFQFVFELYELCSMPLFMG